VSPLSRLTGLETLDLRFNRIASIDSLRCLGSLVKPLELRVQGNPLCVGNYRSAICRILPNVGSVDG
jgi:Leucine-rich repeat (LRR) protein